MEKTKSYTDLEQSKKLAEILPLESADMYYYTVNGNSEWYKTPNVLESIDDLDMDGNSIPCWSLAALLDILPRVIDLDTHHTILDIYPTKNLGWVIEYSNFRDIVDFSFNNENLIDACVEMILKLHELKIL